ncbi:MAG: lipid-A-disaccharide synthase [Rickettsiales bacterium]|nr:lipid-A-disaccharide synthase [Rickettsiales bacterium]
MKKKVFIIAGEKSGDLLGSKILKGLDKNKFDVYGIGGEAMKSEGLNSLFPMEELSVMGVFEILPKIFSLLKRIKETAKKIMELQPDVVLTIDSPDFCFRVMKMVKKLDLNNRIKKVHLIAPSVWVYRKNRAKKIAKIYDLLLCILPFEPPYFEKYGLKTVFVGHPVFDDVVADNHYDKNSKVVSITVGSRKSEVKNLLPIAIGVVNKIKDKERYKYYILATEYTYNYVIDELNKRDISYIHVVKNTDEKDEIIKNSVLAIAKSGTNALELAGFSIPMVVFYRFNFLTNIIAKMVRARSSVKYATIINIMNNREIIPEYLLDRCKEMSIVNGVNKLLENEDLRLTQIKNNVETIQKLGYGNSNPSSVKIVNEIKELLNV